METMSEPRTACIHGVPGERARAAGVVRAAWPLLAAIFLCGFFFGAVAPRLPLGWAGTGFLVGAVFLAWATRDGLRSLEGYFKGARGEEAVAALLAALPAGYHVFHDVACGGAGSVDHVVVGPRGLFVVETKCWSGAVTAEGETVRVDGREPSRQPVAQACASAHALHAFLAARVGAAPACLPLVCFASNTLSEDVVAAGARATLCNAKVLLSLVTAHAGHLSPDEIERVVKVMEHKAS